MFRYTVLGLLRNGVAYHGYALMKEYRERSGQSISTGNFYRELQRLVGEGMVRTVTNPPDADPRRAPYEITEQGAAAFDAWLAGPPAGIGSYDDELSSRAIFVGEADVPVSRSMIDRWREELWIRGKMIERAREAALMQSDTDAKFSVLTILLARGLKHVAADLEFLDELRRAFEEWAATPQPKAHPPRSRSAAVIRASRRRSRGGPEESR